MEKIYCFKIYYKNGQSKVLGGKASKPEYLYGDFDGMISQEEYHQISISKLNIKELLHTASMIFKTVFVDINKIEIINIKTNQIIDFIDC
ncbi:MAG: hypothetical protein J6Q51_00605 [Clostridia bacterium]|nr:hypothetical protein [Clostridia bacterium]